MTQEKFEKAKLLAEEIRQTEVDILNYERILNRDNISLQLTVDGMPPLIINRYVIMSQVLGSVILNLNKKLSELKSEFENL